MSLKPPTRAMRANPDLDQLKRQAKELLEAYRASSPQAVAEVSAYHRTATPDAFALHDAQFVLALPACRTQLSCNPKQCGLVDLTRPELLECHFQFAAQANARNTKRGNRNQRLGCRR